VYIAVVAAWVDVTVGHRLQDGTAHFVQVLAIGEPTVINIRTNVAE
jgi:hypothetical protein